jgi:hypothetical protein
MVEVKDFQLKKGIDEFLTNARNNQAQLSESPGYKLSGNRYGHSCSRSLGVSALTGMRRKGVRESAGINRLGVGNERVKRENREIPETSSRTSRDAIVERLENASGGTADMYVSGKSDDFVVPTKLANKTGTPAAESMEGRESPKSSCVRFAIAPDTVTDKAVGAKVHARHVAMEIIATVIA